jgi:hypothetical protein
MERRWTFSPVVRVELTMPQVAAAWTSRFGRAIPIAPVANRAVRRVVKYILAVVVNLDGRACVDGVMQRNCCDSVRGLYSRVAI